MIKIMKSGFVSIIGKPNAGKSTLLNCIIGEKIAAVSDKPQTTRNAISGIYTEKDMQIVFMDTPGIHKPKNKLGEFMSKEIEGAMNSVDITVLVVDCTEKTNANDEIIANLSGSKMPVLLVINKIDLVEKEQLLKIIAEYSSKMDFKAFIPISALENDGVEVLLSEIKDFLEEGPMYFPEDMLTDQPEKQIMAEFIREKALRCLDKEVPHGIAVEITSFKESENGVLKISATIFCEKKSHKGIIIGKGGLMLKKIGQLSRKEAEEFFGTKVFLELWVKIKEDWRNSDIMLKNFGFTND